MLGVARHGFQGRQEVLHRVVADTPDSHRAVEVVPDGVLRGFLAHLACLVLVDLAHAAEETALQVAERVCTHALDLRLALDHRAEQVTQGARARKLHVAVGVTLAACELFSDCLALTVHDALGHGDDATAVLAVHLLHIGHELLLAESALRHVDQVRAVIRVFARQTGRRGQESRMPAHHHADVHAGNGAVVEIGAREGLGHELRRGAVARAVVRHLEVIVDGLGNMNHPQFVPGIRRLFIHDSAGVGAVIAAAVEKIANVVRLADLKDRVAIGLVRFVPRGQEPR